MTRAVRVALLTLGALPRAAAAQQPSEAAALAERYAAMTAVSGYEQSLVDTTLQLLPGSARDRAGNALLRIGQGDHRRLVVCAADEPGWVVGGVREDGYLTLRRVGRTPGALADQQLEGQRVTLFGRVRPVPGVVGVHSVHLTRGRGAPSSEPFSLDSAYVDVGARSRADVAALGVRTLAPVALEKRPHRYGTGLLAAPAAGARAACAALVAAARQATAERGMVPGAAAVFVAVAVEARFTGRGLATLAAASGPFDETLLLDAAAGAAGSLDAIPLPADAAGRSSAPRLGAVTRWTIHTRYAGSPVETVALADVDRLTRQLVAWMRGDR